MIVSWGHISSFIGQNDYICWRAYFNSVKFVGFSLILLEIESFDGCVDSKSVLKYETPSTFGNRFSSRSTDIKTKYRFFRTKWRLLEGYIREIGGLVFYNKPRIFSPVWNWFHYCSNNSLLYVHEFDLILIVTFNSLDHKSYSNNLDFLNLF